MLHTETRHGDGDLDGRVSRSPEHTGAGRIEMSVEAFRPKGMSTLTSRYHSENNLLVSAKAQMQNVEQCGPRRANSAAEIHLDARDSINSATSSGS